MLETRITVDKLRIRYSYDATAQSESEFKQLQQFKHSVKDGSLGKKGKTWMASKAAITFMALPLPSGAKLFVQYGFVHGRFWSWIEFNPSRLSEEDCCLVSTCFNLLFTHGIETLWSRGRIARIDVAIDAIPVLFHKCLFLDKRLRASLHAYDANGSTYLGSKNGQRSMLLYDKAKERWDKAKEVVGKPWLRLEARVYDPKRWALHDIQSLLNPFLTLLVVDKDALSATDCTTLAPIRAHLAEGEALDRIYSKLPPSLRKLAWNSLQDLQTPWWDPQTMWNQYGKALSWLHELLGPALQSIAQPLSKPKLPKQSPA